MNAHIVHHFEDDRLSGYQTLFIDQFNARVAAFADPIFPPVGTEVLLVDGTWSVVESISLDLSNSDGLAMVRVHVQVKGEATISALAPSLNDEANDFRRPGKPNT
ncbi:hypothetical protein [Arthrobacter sp. A5]|uniref:hypothetical protein n=1 Tax=Arthrobacter sp. A5 TaxID=576926 RepID=UPI003DA920B2